ncbi:hypothetical protein [Pseudooceanicola onchidii]|uniref:hypothetical protein n=1 Tax=Pseudooceanicola onchidii TaxID=2562279 RepID=UPI0010AA894D|nr:hypothetical protein [Pseudooceanicola onchidii]
MRTPAAVLTLCATTAVADMPVAITRDLDRCMVASVDQQSDMRCMTTAFQACGTSDAACLIALDARVTAAADALVQDIDPSAMAGATKKEALKRRMFLRRLNRVSKRVDRTCGSDQTPETCAVLASTVRWLELRSLSREVAG